MNSREKNKVCAWSGLAKTFKEIYWVNVKNWCKIKQAKK